MGFIINSGRCRKYVAGGFLIFSTCSFCTKPKSRRWSIASFSYVMITCRGNCQTLTTMNNGGDARKVNSFDFGKMLAMEIVMPFLKNTNTAKLSNAILLKMYLVTNDQKYLNAVLCEKCGSVKCNKRHLVKVCFSC